MPGSEHLVGSFIYPIFTTTTRKTEHNSISPYPKATYSVSKLNQQLQPNASLSSLLNLADVRTKFRRQQLFLMQPAVVFPHLLHNFHHLFSFFVQLQSGQFHTVRATFADANYRFGIQGAQIAVKLGFKGCLLYTSQPVLLNWPAQIEMGG